MQSRKITDPLKHKFAKIHKTQEYGAAFHPDSLWHTP